MIGDNPSKEECEYIDKTIEKLTLDIENVIRIFRKNSKTKFSIKVFNSIIELSLISNIAMLLYTGIGDMDGRLHQLQYMWRKIYEKLLEVEQRDKAH